jgi:hypothetical protein
MVASESVGFASMMADRCCPAKTVPHPETPAQTRLISVIHQLRAIHQLLYNDHSSACELRTDGQAQRQAPA